MRARPWMGTTGEATRAALAKQPPGDLGCCKRAKPLEDCQGCALARFFAIEQRQRLLPWATDALPDGGGGMPVTSHLKDVGFRNARRLVGQATTAPQPDDHFANLPGEYLVWRRL